MHMMPSQCHYTFIRTVEGNTRKLQTSFHVLESKRLPTVKKMGGPAVWHRSKQHWQLPSSG